MNLILTILGLTFISRADCFERKFEGCEESSEIYIQWYPPISGWYTRNLLNKNEYTRTLPNITELCKYEFLLEEGEWNVNIWTKASSKGIAFSRRDDEMITYLPKPSNIKSYHPSPLSRRKRSGKRTGLTRRPSSKYKDKEMPNKTRNPRMMTNLKPDENQAQPMTTDDVPAFNVYCPGKCRCMRAGVGSVNFTRFDAADINTKEMCWGRIENATELPEENKKFHRIKNTNQSTIDYDVYNDIDYDETFPEIDFRYESNKWKPELYVSENCEVLYYNKLYDTWIVDFEWDARNCNTFISSGAGIENYVSNNSAPCLEYLPVARYQQWSNPQPYDGSSDPPEEADYIIEHCGMNFTLKLNKYFKVTCLELEQAG